MHNGKKEEKKDKMFVNKWFSAALIQSFFIYFGNLESRNQQEDTIVFKNPLIKKKTPEEK